MIVELIDELRINIDFMPYIQPAAVLEDGEAIALLYLVPILKGVGQLFNSIAII